MLGNAILTVSALGLQNYRFLDSQHIEILAQPKADVNRKEKEKSDVSA